MDEDGHSPLLPGALGKPDVIGMAVRQHDRPDVRERMPHGAELAPEVRPVAGQSGVDDRDPSPIGDEIRVNEAVAESMDPVPDPHRAQRRRNR